MCGRLNITDDLVAQWVCNYLGIPFTIKPNTDLRPNQEVSTVVYDGSLRQFNTTWGIQPSWSKKLLINAQAETAATKKTFKTAFSANRCLVPCTGWYEWRDEGGARKQKYSFTHVDGIPFLMAGIWFEHEVMPQLVTLTTHPNQPCAEIHNRMPVLIMPEDVDRWFGATAEEVQFMIEQVGGEVIKIEKC